MGDGKIYIYGRHSVMEAVLHKKEVILEVFFIEDSKDKHLQSLVFEAGIKTSVLDSKNLPGDLDKSVTHQGVVAVISEKKLMVLYKDFVSGLKISPQTALLVLGEVQDPHNVGAVIRSAAAFGISGVLIPPHNQAGVSGAVVKVSAGMAFRVPLVSISNVNTALRDLKEKGFWTYGLDGRGETVLGEEKFEKPSVFVLGNEGEGLRKMTGETCDILLKIPLHERCESMNASASVAVVLYEWARQHPDALT